MYVASRNPDAVSIHAPARGATLYISLRVRLISEFQFTRPRGARHEYWPEFAHLGVSIHAPARGATFLPLAKCIVISSFNSRAREGRDYSGASLTCPMGTVSIHAPARGATQYNKSHSPLASVSIHAPARGATGLGSTNFTGGVFQFTRPRGARHAGKAKYNAMLYSFNSRAREGRDLRFVLHSQHTGVSIHAPARGATTSRLDGWRR